MKISSMVGDDDNSDHVLDLNSKIEKIDYDFRNDDLESEILKT